ncbi:indole-3-glycerol-phosphate synthase, partial [Alphaproteobacteria bacterium]|nr:indole-3-glycerol-phosphate synthase [Alphaproteobacteria bacterium]
MNNILKKICEDKKLEIEILKKKCSLNSLKKLISDQINKRDFKNVIIKSSLERENFIIGEIKKASPSAGEIIPNYEPVEIAKIYQNTGIKALSVLTEKNYFKGEIDHLSYIKQNTNIPILRKDFIIDEYQI